MENKESAIPATNTERLNADIVAANTVLEDLVNISTRLINNYAYNSETSENTINDYFRDLLLTMGYKEIKDQTRHGVSSTGNDAGEVDILISKEKKEIALFEGMRLSSVDSTYIDKHIEKTVVNYNPLGTATFIVAYVSSNNFEQFWNRYTDYLKEYEYPIQTKSELIINTAPNAAIRIAHIILSRDGFDFPVYYLALKIN